MRCATLVATALAVGLAACASSSTLVVQVTSDMRAGADADAIEVRVFDATGASVGSSSVELTAPRSLARPLRAGAFELPPGTFEVQSTLTRSGLPVQTRRARVRVAGTTFLTLLMLRDCNGVSCPGAAEVSAIACLGGRCISPECSEENPAACGTPACRADTDCPASTVACVAGRCSPSGACWLGADDTRCAADQACDAILGCVPDAPGPASALLHQYRFAGDYEDDLGGPPLVPHGGALVAGGGYRFAPNQGLSVTGALPDHVYTLDLVLSLDTLDLWRRIVDYDDRTRDEGLYAIDGMLSFVVAFGVFETASDAFAAGVETRVTITRDDASRVTVYRDGAQALSFTDRREIGALPAPGAVVHFFMDDLVDPDEASAGVVRRIRIFDRALTAAEVPTL